MAHGSGDGRMKRGRKLLAEAERATDVLRRAILDSGLALAELSRRSGVQTSALSRFMNGERSIGLSTFEALAAELRLRVVRAKGPGRALGAGEEKATGR
jgi:transcriptional regulator with XRE-family HTH domain